ncbi:unnamed protein product, partial [Ectocarpus sp. 8 AP-2014]
MGEKGLLAKAGSTISAFFVVPLVAAILLCWTVVGFLCSLKGCGVFVYVSVLVVTAGLIDTRMGQDDYAFDSSLLDPAAVLVVAYLCYRVLLRHHDTNASLAGSRRLASIPVAAAVAAFLSVKIVAVAGNEAQDRQGWKLAWLWLALVSSAFVYASMARWWTDASMPRLQEAEAALLEKYAQVEFEQSVVAGLGTVCVKGFHQSFEAGGPSREAAPEKPVLVLLHGYAAGNGFWMFVLKELSEHFRVACVEMYGCGRSERLPFKAKGPAETEKILVESLEKWRAEMGITEMVLCGHSLGGMVASAYAMAHPDRLRKLFLLSPAGIGGIPMDGDVGKDRLMYKIYSFFWTRGVGFLFLLRWAGPLGMRAAKSVVAKRLSWVPEA